MGVIIERILYWTDAGTGNMWICNWWMCVFYQIEMMIDNNNNNGNLWSAYPAAQRKCEWESECMHYNDGRMHAIWLNAPQWGKQNKTKQTNKQTKTKIPQWPKAEQLRLAGSIMTRPVNIDDHFISWMHFIIIYMLQRVCSIIIILTAHTSVKADRITFITIHTTTTTATTTTTTTTTKQQ